jgi:hypothetical protein
MPYFKPFPVTGLTLGASAVEPDCCAQMQQNLLVLIYRNQSASTQPIAGGLEIGSQPVQYQVGLRVCTVERKADPQPNLRDPDCEE